MRSVRTFIAVELSGTVIARAQEAIKLLKGSGAEVGWVDRGQMHLTLKFLGNVPETETPDVCRVVAEAAAGVEPFEIVFKGLGAFPRASEPRTIWMGIDQGQAELAELHEAIGSVQSDKDESGIVVYEVQRGYRWGDEVLRPARVRVAQ